MKYFTADPHFSKISTNTLNRPFTNSLEMSKYILEKINIRVKRNDELFILGDFAFDNLSWFRQQIRCKHIRLIYGNHDLPKKQCKEVFGEFNVKDVWITHCKDIQCFLSHYAHAYWPKSHYNSFHLYGHCHHMREKTLDKVFPERRSMDCGLDTAKIYIGDYYPFSEEEIYWILSPRKGHDPVEFYTQKHGAYKKDHIHEEIS